MALLQPKPYFCQLHGGRRHILVGLQLLKLTCSSVTFGTQCRGRYMQIAGHEELNWPSSTTLGRSAACKYGSNRSPGLRAASVHLRLEVIFDRSCNIEILPEQRPSALHVTTRMPSPTLFWRSSDIVHYEILTGHAMTSVGTYSPH